MLKGEAEHLLHTVSHTHPSTSLPTAVTTFSPAKSKRQKKYRSVISDVFDGTIVSSVQCLTCDRVSVRVFYCEMILKYFCSEQTLTQTGLFVQGELE